MNIRKAIKKIAAVGTGALLVGSSLLGASAATLEGFPQPFVTADGQGDVQFVIGNGATDDYLGALDIAVALQAAAVSEETVNVPGVGTTVSIDDGAKIATSSKDLNYGEALSAVKTKLNDEDLPQLLRDGSIIDDDVEKEEYDYEQTIELGDAAVAFGIPDDDVFKDPVVYLDLEDEVAYEVVVDMKDALMITSDGDDGEGLDDSETIEIAGKSFTFKNDLGDDDDLILYGSDTTTYLELNQPITVDISGNSYTLEVVGANSEGTSTMILDVNGQRKTLKEGDSTTINGLEVFIKDLFVTNIPVLSASANVFVGSEEVTIPANSRTTGAASFKDIKVNGQKLDGVEVQVTVGTADEWSDVSEIRFRVTPSELDDEIDYLVAGESFRDPLFETFEFMFERASIAEDSSAKEMTTLKRSGSKYSLTFINEEGDEYTLPLAEEEADDLQVGDNLGDDSVSVVASGNIGEDAIFILSEDSGESEVTKVYKVVTVDDDENEVIFEDLSSGKEIKVSAGDELEDTGYYVFENGATETTNIADENFQFGDGAGSAIDTLPYIVTKNDVKISFEDIGDTTVDVMVVTVEEDFDGAIEDEAAGATFTFEIGLDGGTSGDIAITSDIAEDGASSADFVVVSDDDGDYKYGLSEQGLYVKQEVDNDGDELIIYAPDVEVHYNAFIAPKGANVVVSGSDGSSVTTQKVNELAVGIAVRDTEVNLANPAKNLIVVGGTCINSVAAELKGVAAGTCGTDSGLNPNEAIIELFDLDNGKVAMLVAGWEATETQAAARAVATQDAALSGTSAKLTVTSATNYQIVN